LFGEGLRRLQETSAYLYHDGDRYWFSTQPTLNQLADDRARAQSEAAVENEIVRLLRDLNRQEGLTIVMVTHNLDIVAATDRVVRLMAGRVQDADEPPAAGPPGYPTPFGLPLGKACG